jgi:hypothetical protein
MKGVSFMLQLSLLCGNMYQLDSGVGSRAILEVVVLLMVTKP